MRKAKVNLATIIVSYLTSICWLTLANWQAARHPSDSLPSKVSFRTYFLVTFQHNMYLENIIRGSKAHRDNESTQIQGYARC